MIRYEKYTDESPLIDVRLGKELVCSVCWVADGNLFMSCGRCYLMGCADGACIEMEGLDGNMALCSKM